MASLAETQHPMQSSGFFRDLSCAPSSNWLVPSSNTFGLNPVDKQARRNLPSYVNALDLILSMRSTPLREELMPTMMLPLTPLNNTMLDIAAAASS